jgi:hypothetical protein
MKFFAAVMAVLLCVQALPAAEQKVITYDLVDFKPARASQRTAMWCWAACIEMVANYSVKELAVVQEQVVIRNYGVPAVVGAMSFEQIRANLDLWLPNSKGKDVKLVAESHYNVLDAEEVEEQLKKKRPFILGVNGQSHVVVCYGAKISVSESGEKTLESIHIFDPWPSKSDQWLTRQQWPSHESYRWEFTITTETEETEFVSHPLAIAKRFSVGSWQAIPSPIGTRFQLPLMLRSGDSPTAVWTRAVYRNPATGAVQWADNRNVILSEFKVGGYGGVVFDVPANIPPTSVFVLSLEY